MASETMAEKFGKKRPSKFSDEGPPDKGGDAPDDMEEAPPSSMTEAPDGDEPTGGDDVEMKAVDSMSDILGVGPEDRDDFAAALQAYVSACLAKTLAPEPAMPAGPPGMPPAAMEAPSDEEE